MGIQETINFCKCTLTAVAQSAESAADVINACRELMNIAGFEVELNQRAHMMNGLDNLFGDAEPMEE